MAQHRAREAGSRGLAAADRGDDLRRSGGSNPYGGMLTGGFDAYAEFDDDDNDQVFGFDSLHSALGKPLSRRRPKSSYASPNPKSGESGQAILRAQLALHKLRSSVSALHGGPTGGGGGGGGKAAQGQVLPPESR